MKPLPLILLAIVLLIPVPRGFAETDATAVDTLVVDLWPDYDKASVLVLLTGTLPKESQLPARVTLPFPEGAHLNAVARIDTRNGSMKDDILSSPGLGELSFITPDPAFRVEYYLPYKAKDKQRDFDFTWQSDLTIAKFHLKIQRPAAASAFKTVPAAAQVVQDENGLTYYVFPVQSLSAGQPFKLHVDYTMDQNQLSVNSLPPANLNPPSSAPPAQAPAGPGINWPYLALIAGSVLVVLAIIWMVVAQRGAPRKASSGAVRKGASAPEKFCRNCGYAITENDKYCANCGKQL